MKPYFSNKGLSSNKLMLKKKKPTYCRGKGVSRCNDTFFVNITKGLDIKKDNDSSLNSISYQNIKDVIEKTKITSVYAKLDKCSGLIKRFLFKIVTEDIVRKEIMKLDGSKTTPIGDISINILKSIVDI